MSMSHGPGQTIVPNEKMSALPDICRPRALGPVPRLGLGSRTTVLGWPAIFAFLSKNGIYANAIQNSVARELMPIEMLKNPDKRADTYLPGLGPVQVGHTGSTIEGLVQWGALSAAETGYDGPGFGADADHLPVYRPDSKQWKNTVALIRCSRGYTHFTLDIGSIVDWKKEPMSRLEDVPHAITAAVNEIEKVRGMEPFDLEISLDESPNDIAPDVAATTADEMEWLLDALTTDGITVDYAAPHFGFTKGSDAADHEHLAKNTEKLFHVAGDRGALLSIHSGDYLSPATRRVFGRVCQGELLYKVSPALQDIFINVVLRNDPSLTDELTVWVTKHASERGYECKSPEEALHKCAFAAFGVQNNAACFEMRDMLYGVADEVKEAYQRELTAYLDTLSEDLMIRKKG